MLISEAFKPTKVLEFSEETFLVNENNYKENYFSTLPISFELMYSGRSLEANKTNRRPGLIYFLGGR